MLPALINLPEVTKDLLKNWDRALPISLYYNHLDEAKQELITKEITEFYFNNQKLTEGTKKNLTNVRNLMNFSPSLFFPLFLSLSLFPLCFSISLYFY